MNDELINAGMEFGATRRRLIQAAAWTAPVVLVGAASPAFASSGQIIDFAVSLEYVSGRGDSEDNRIRRGDEIVLKAKVVNLSNVVVPAGLTIRAVRNAGMVPTFTGLEDWVQSQTPVHDVFTNPLEVPVGSSFEITITAIWDAGETAGRTSYTVTIPNGIVGDSVSTNNVGAVPIHWTFA